MPADRTGVEERVTYRLSAVAGRYRWRSAGREVASAAWHDHCWDLRDRGGDEVVLRVVGGIHRGRTRVALVDPLSHRTVVFVTGAPMSRADIGALTDSYGETLMEVRADPLAGLSILDPAGRLLAVSSRRHGDGLGTDLVVTSAARSGDLWPLFGLSLTFELLRAGAVHAVA